MWLCVAMRPLVPGHGWSSVSAEATGIAHEGPLIRVSEPHVLVQSWLFHSCVIAYLTSESRTKKAWVTDLLTDTSLIVLLIGANYLIADFCVCLRMTWFFNMCSAIHLKSQNSHANVASSWRPSISWPCFAVVCLTRFCFCGVLKSQTLQQYSESSKCCFKCKLSPTLVLKTLRQIWQLFLLDSSGKCSERCLM